jgi:hypothetical protein
MKHRYVGLALGTLIVVGAALALPSCGHDQKLVSMQISPSTYTFLFPTPSASEQYTAVANYIHPPATKDVTSQATWSVDNGVVTINGGLVSPANTTGCGGATISAMVPEGTGGASNIVVAYATTTVDNPAILQCPGGGTVATLSVGVVGTGLVTSTPGGISCPSTCIASYDVGASVLLTASGGSFTGWSPTCIAQTPTTPQCTVTIPAGGAAVSASFQ